MIQETENPVLEEIHILALRSMGYEVTGSVGGRAREAWKHMPQEKRSEVLAEARERLGV